MSPCATGAVSLWLLCKTVGVKLLVSPETILSFFTGERFMSSIDSPVFSSMTTRRVQIALQAVRDGIPVILSDNDDRENEADLIVAAEKINQHTMAMMIRECSGIVCLCLTPQHATELGLKPMVEQNRSRYQTAFTTSIEARDGVTTGVSAADRVTTIRAAMHTQGETRIVSPGHVFPLIARAGGVLERDGHTEGSVDLARLAGLRPVGVLCELMNADGSMMAGEQINRFAAENGLPRLSIAELIAYRRNHLI